MVRKAVTTKPSLDEPKVEQEAIEETTTATAEVEEPTFEESEPESPEEITPAPAPEPEVVLSAHAPMGSKARAMRDHLASEPKVRVFIPLASGEKQGVTQSVILNGYPLYIRKGTYVNVPESVAEVLETKLKEKMSLENHPSRISSEGEVKMTAYGN
jgi:hypothetical protein